MKHAPILKSTLRIALLGCTTAGLIGSLPLMAKPHRPGPPPSTDGQSPQGSPNRNERAPLHIEQDELLQMIESGEATRAFETAFDVGDRLFEWRFRADEGVGANVGNGQRFTLVPRADLNSDGQWAAHIPQRFTGPNAQSCNVCHGSPFGDGAGPVVLNNVRDPQHTGLIDAFITRQTPHVFGIGALQRLAEEMSEELALIRTDAIAQASFSGQPVTAALQTKGINYGSITASADGTLDISNISGIDSDLLVKPLQWKGIVKNIRAFVRGASHNELGMQAVESTGDGVDGDGDGVINELSVGDITAITIYQAAQPRPTTKMELSWLGLIRPLSAEERQDITLGEQLFDDTGCGSCHTPQLTLNNPIFSEPSQNPNYRDEIFPGGQDPESEGVSAISPIQFDLTQDLPDNIIRHQNGDITHLGNFESNNNGGAIVSLYGDLKRHDMGNDLAEAVDEVGTGASNFLTKELWGVGSTAPYLHDGRATTLSEAISFHGGESADSRDNFNALSGDEQKALIAFLKNLVLYKTREK